ncbi:hypothetical protein M408DRAFT_331056 [Serendipita vermifera MAFF 305830]|uniref:SH3 domain-containing protein n=1 Tax=Serendipita vermifera MAFF 305830 TaxID=933852 RepID=A0A0C3B2G8_SERVB|nr:hypothetical protein M408DRAFT_331056 [Serendipita vermifera MAFF 305830]
MNSQVPNLPSPPGSDANTAANNVEKLQSILRSTYIQTSCFLLPVTFAIVLVDLLADRDAGHVPEIERICLPLLTATKGERIRVVDRYSPEIWIGSIGNRQGAFKLDETVQPVLGKKVRALYSWTPPAGEEGLTFSKGDIIEVVRHHEDWNWWFLGTLGGSTDLVPFNFVETTLDETEPDFEQVLAEWTSASSSSQGELRACALYDYNPSDEADLSFKKGDIITVLQKYDHGWWDGRLDGRTGAIPKNYFTFCIPSPSPKLVVRNPPPWDPYYVRTLYGYSSTDQSELSFSAGEIIEVSDISLAPWLEGRRRNGQTGLFPINYTTRILDRRTPTSQAYAPNLDVSI